MKVSGVRCQPCCWPEKRPVKSKKKLWSDEVSNDAEKANIEYRIMNIECRRNAFYRFL